LGKQEISKDIKALNITLAPINICNIKNLTKANYKDKKTTAEKIWNLQN